jgi:hypothetical protein
MPAGTDIRVPDAQPGVCAKNVGANAFSLVATLFWLYMLQPGRNVLVSGVWVLQAGVI